MKKKENCLTNNKLVLLVTKSEGQKVINELKVQGLYDKTREIVQEKNELWIPIKQKMLGAEAKKLPFKRHLKTLVEKYGIRSFDIIGSIIVIFIPNDLIAQKNDIGKYLMHLYPRITAVYREMAETKGKFRIQTKELIAGAGSETIHKENGLKFKLDITQVYFSPRQTTERIELTKITQNSEKICVFFSGTGPIPIYLAKFTHAKKIVGIELNPKAHEYALINLTLNSVNNVDLINGDVNLVVPEIIQEGLFDCIIMPLPKNSESFIEIAKRALIPNGILIMYIPGTKEILDEKVLELMKARFSIEYIKRSSEIAPMEWRYEIFARKENSN